MKTSWEMTPKHLSNTHELNLNTPHGQVSRRAGFRGSVPAKLERRGQWARSRRRCMNRKGCLGRISNKQISDQPAYIPVSLTVSVNHVHEIRCVLAVCSVQ